MYVTCTALAAGIILQFQLVVTNYVEQVEQLQPSSSEYAKWSIKFEQIDKEVQKILGEISDDFQIKNEAQCGRNIRGYVNDTLVVTQVCNGVLKVCKDATQTCRGTSKIARDTRDTAQISNKANKATCVNCQTVKLCQSSNTVCQATVTAVEASHIAFLTTKRTIEIDSQTLAAIVDYSNELCPVTGEYFIKALIEIAEVTTSAFEDTSETYQTMMEAFDVMSDDCLAKLKTCQATNNNNTEL